MGSNLIRLVKVKEVMLSEFECAVIITVIIGLCSIVGCIAYWSHTEEMKRIEKETEVKD